MPDLELDVDARVVAIEVAGVDARLEKAVRAAIKSRRGRPLDREVIAADIRRLFALGLFSDVEVTARRRRRGLAIRYALHTHRAVGRVEVRGVPPADHAYHRRQLRALEGTNFVAPRMTRAARSLEALWRVDGYLDARIEVATRPGVDRSKVAVCFALDPGPRYTIGKLEWAGNKRVSDRALSRALDTSGGRSNVKGGVLLRDQLERDLTAVQRIYYDRGMITIEVGRPVIETDRRRATISITIPIREGPVFRIGAVAITGLLGPAGAFYRRRLGVKTGDVFSRKRVFDGIDRIRAAARARGIAKLDIQVSTQIDDDRHVVSLELETLKVK